MASSVLVPVSEYLKTMYHPDCDYVDGEVKERNLGEQPHSALQAFITGFFLNHRKEWQIRVLTEQRVQITPTRYRIPDICVLRQHDPKDRIITWAPLLCIEVLSEEDRLNELQTKVNEFANLGVNHIWVLDPWKRIAYYATPKGFVQPEDGTLRIEGTPIAIRLAELFAELDEL